jgi:hypothetical protein
LSEEFGKVGRQLPGERLLESIDPEGTLCRMNLRPYRATGGTLESLFDAMLLTQHTVNGTRSDFFRLWREAKKLRKTRLLPFGLDEMEKFELLLQQRGLPVLHHSESYVRFNHPAYRVVASEHALDLVEG